jgi:hypothetical protein
MGFVLLSVENGKPLIDDYEAVPDETVTKPTHTVAKAIERAKALYTLAPFSFSILADVSGPRVKDHPESCVRFWLENNVWMHYDVVGPPYVVKRWDGEKLYNVPNDLLPEGTVLPGAPC